MPIVVAFERDVIYLLCERNVIIPNIIRTKSQYGVILLLERLDRSNSALYVRYLLGSFRSAGVGFARGGGCDACVERLWE